jgi:hypothetical protein
VRLALSSVALLGVLLLYRLGLLLYVLLLCRLALFLRVLLLCGLGLLLCVLLLCRLGLLLCMLLLCRLLLRVLFLCGFSPLRMFFLPFFLPCISRSSGSQKHKQYCCGDCYFHVCYLNF